MTAEEHNKTIGILFLIFGSCSLVLLIPIALQILRTLNGLERLSADAAADVAQNQQNAIALLFILIVVLGVLSAVASIIEIAAGYAILKRKPWALTATVLAAIVALINFPIGTILSIYAAWFLFGKSGRQVYGNRTANAARKKS